MDREHGRMHHNYVYYAERHKASQEFLAESMGTGDLSDGALGKPV